MLKCFENAKCKWRWCDENVKYHERRCVSNIKIVRIQKYYFKGWNI